MMALGGPHVKESFSMPEYTLRLPDPEESEFGCRA